MRSLMIRAILLVSILTQAAAQAPSVVVPGAGSTAGVGHSADESKTYTIPVGTKILLSLKTEISTRLAMPGDPVYFVSDFPVVEDGGVVLPAGMYVKGVIDRVQRPGRVRGQAEIQMHAASMILPNGEEIQLPLTLDEVPGSNGARVKNAEGTIEQDPSKGQDTQRIATNTIEGTGLGSVVGSSTGSAGLGAGIGAGTGAAVGLLTTLLTRGKDVVFPQGTPLEMVLSRPLVLQRQQLDGMSTYAGNTESKPNR